MDFLSVFFSVFLLIAIPTANLDVGLVPPSGTHAVRALSLSLSLTPRIWKQGDDDDVDKTKDKGALIDLGGEGVFLYFIVVLVVVVFDLVLFFLL